MTAVNMAQLQLEAPGAPLEMARAPVPRPGPDQVLIRQKYISLNGLDYKQRDYGIRIEHWPFVLGIEGAGTVELVGQNVTDIRVGDEVAARVHETGSYQEYTIASREDVVKKPKNVSLQDLASLPIGYATAFCAIYDGLKVPLPFTPGTKTTGNSPKSVLVLGGSSVVGATAIQILRLAYPTLPVFATSSARHHQLVKSMGANKVFDYKAQDMVSSIIGASPGSKGIDMILDCVGSGGQQTEIFGTFDPAGAKWYSEVLSGPPFAVPEGVTRIQVDAASLTSLEGGKQVLPLLTQLLEAGKIKPPVPVVIVGKGLDEVPAALDKVKTVSGAKLLVAL